MKRLDIGCGNDPISNAIGIDKRRYERVDVIGDAMNLPFTDNSFDEVNASQLLEHLDGRTELPQVFEEVWRVLKDTGQFRFDVPIGRAWDADPTHQTKWRFKTVVYFLTRKEVSRLGWNPETFPDYYDNYSFEFELVDRDCVVWLTGESLPMRGLSFALRNISERLTTDKWIEIPFVAGNIKIVLRKIDD